MSPREAGLDAGRGFAPKLEALRAVLSKLDVEADTKRSEVQAAIVAKTIEREVAARRVAAIETEADLLKDRRAALSSERAMEPAKYSIPRALLFVLLGLCAIVGDLAFLGTILAMLVGSPVVTSNGDTIAKLLLTNPRQALTEFPEVTLLAVSVLTAGFVVKLWHQHAAARHRGASRAWFLFLSIGVLLTLAVLILISAVRLQLPLNGDFGLYDTSLGRSATALLGFSLPLVAAFFLTEGIDALGRRYELWRASISGALAAQRLKRATASKDEVIGAIALLEAQRDAIGAQWAVTGTRAAAESEFECGYEEGVRGILETDSGGGLFRQLRSATVARLARGATQ